MGKKRIILTGGGTTGHVSVNLALIPLLFEDGWEVSYIGSEKGIERELIADYPQVTYYPIATGKLRRYFSKENFKDVGRVIKGIGQARSLIRSIKPHIIFSKGGFVAVPVVLGAFFNRVPVISHESDLTPGLANKITLPFVEKVMLTFEDSQEFIKKDKAFYLGPVIREQIKNGSREEGLQTYGFSGKKPVLLTMGGSLGAKGLNEAIWANLDALLERFDILHGVGKGKGNPDINRPGYIQEEYIKAGMNHALAMADMIVSRSGANAIFEFLYYRKPMLLIPLPSRQSRGDQILNAEKFQARNYGKMLLEEDLNPQSFHQAIEDVYNRREEIIQAQEGFVFRDTVQIIIDELNRDAKFS